jgi:ABC-2 type transport system permease protein
MGAVLEKMSVLFPLRHYYLLYVNQALNGYPIGYVRWSVVALVVFALLPLLVLPMYRKAFLVLKYKP